MNSELQNKLSQLYQRRRARETTQLLPEILREEIELERLSYKEEIYSAHGLNLYPKGVRGEYVYPEGCSLYEYVEVDQPFHLAIKIDESGLVFDTEVFVSLDDDSGFWPLKKERMEQLISWYINYIESNDQRLAVFQADFKKGFVVDSYCGYLPKHLCTNANEVVYEYIRWEKI